MPPSGREILFPCKEVYKLYFKLHVLYVAPHRLCSAT
jgi:hypothetical protein